jgi:hypothetical protein
MTQPAPGHKWLSILFGVILLIAFFLPWLNWVDTTISGCDMPYGRFFEVSEQKFDLANPFPEYSFANVIFWLIPIMSGLVIVLLLLNKKTGLLPAVPAVIALSLATMYILFTNTIIEQVGLVKSLGPALNIGLYATVVAATGIILASIGRKWWLRASLIIIGPLCTWSGYEFLSGQVLRDHDHTSAVTSAYTVNGLEMIREFQANDSLANVKYKEQIITVNGRASEVEVLNDTTVNIKISDTTGSYLIFSFGDKEAAVAKEIKQGDSISVKGSCSGGEYSDILGVNFITFKRSIINKQ